MRVLGVETATSVLSLALLEGDRVVARSDRDAEGRHARYLIPSIEALLATARCPLEDVDGYAVSIGPGSFTGLRVGLATMMGFRMATGRPLVTVSTLDALAYNVAGSTLDLCPVLRARTGEVYWATYRWVEQRLVRLTDERVGTLAEFSEFCEGPLVLYGEGWETNREAVLALLERSSGRIREVRGPEQRASAVSVALLGQDKLQRGEVAGEGIAPRYVQRAEAELVLLRRQGLANASQPAS